MEQTSTVRDTHRASHKNPQKNKRKKRRLKQLLVLLLPTFLLGFLAGLLVGSQKEATVNFVMAPTAPVTQEVETPKEVIPEVDLPWNVTLVNFENELSPDFEPKELAEVDNGYVADVRITEAAKKNDRRCPFYRKRTYYRAFRI